MALLYGPRKYKQGVGESNTYSNTYSNSYYSKGPNKRVGTNERVGLTVF